jgi:LysM repeat protein
MTPLPTATPFTHTVSKGETMLGIALKYGVSLEDLKTANPGVDPGFLVIGSLLIIPIEGQISGALPTSTPIPVQWRAPICYPTAESGMWCFLWVKNDQSVSLENLSAWIGLFNSNGENIAAKTAFSPLNLLHPGESIPLMIYFTPPLPTNLTASGELLTALALAPTDQRYLDVKAQVDKTSFNSEKTQALLQGQVLISQRKAPALVWLAAIAYDGGENVVGVRKWEVSTPCGSPEPTQATLSLGPTPAPGTATSTPQPTSPPVIWVACVPFELTVYSLGPSIERVDILAEARP